MTNKIGCGIIYSQGKTPDIDLEATEMTGFEFAKQFDTIEEKMIVLFMDAAKTAYNMAGMDFDILPDQEKMDIVYKMMTR